MTLTVLFSSAGRRVELLNCFRADAQALGLGLRVLAADCGPAASAACQAADASFAVPRCDQPEFISRMLEVCASEKVDLVVPTIDPELVPLARARAAFAGIGTRVVVSGTETVAIARDKRRTAAFLAKHGISAPGTLPLDEFLVNPAALKFPVILKPVDGSSSVGLHEARNPAEVSRLALDAGRYLVQEKWAGREYTVNVFFDRAGRLRSAVPHLRLETRAGEVSKGRTERVPLLLDLAAQLGAVLPAAEGPLCFQSIVGADGAGMIFEINARFGGGFPLAHRAGARFSRWLLEETAGLPVTSGDDWQDGLTMLRYDAAVFSAADR